MLSSFQESCKQILTTDAEVSLRLLNREELLGLQAKVLDRLDELRLERTIDKVHIGPDDIVVLRASRLVTPAEKEAMLAAVWKSLGCRKPPKLVFTDPSVEIEVMEDAN